MVKVNNYPKAGEQKLQRAKNILAGVVAQKSNELAPLLQKYNYPANPNNKQQLSQKVVQAISQKPPFRKELAQLIAASHSNFNGVDLPSRSPEDIQQNIDEVQQQQQAGSGGNFAESVTAIGGLLDSLSGFFTGMRQQRQQAETQFGNEIYEQQNNLSGSGEDKSGTNKVLLWGGVGLAVTALIVVGVIAYRRSRK